jgi:hypothetical protein
MVFGIIFMRKIYKPALKSKWLAKKSKERES